jgi:hypothetical protein
MCRIVSDIVSCENQIHQFFLNQKIGSLLKRSNTNKEKGISPVSVFRVLFTLVFTGKNLYRTLEAGGSCARKECIPSACSRSRKRSSIATRGKIYIWRPSTGRSASDEAGQRSSLRSWSRSAKMTRASRSRLRSFSSGTGAPRSGWPCCPPTMPWATRRSSQLISADGTSRCSSRWQSRFSILPKSARVDPMMLLSPMPPWCAADNTSCWPSPRGPTRTQELLGPCFTPVAKNSGRRPLLKHWSSC